MRNLSKTLALVALSTAAVMAAPAAVAGDDINANAFQAMCDADKDGMVSKAEAMKAIEKMFDKHDTKKKGMLDKAQLEKFLRELMKASG
jgi:hydroxymethylpyrimidine/phosphomethylpyrimidine kinase